MRKKFSLITIILLLLTGCSLREELNIGEQGNKIEITTTKEANTMHEYKNEVAGFSIELPNNWNPYIPTVERANCLHFISDELEEYNREWTEENLDAGATDAVITNDFTICRNAEPFTGLYGDIAKDSQESLQVGDYMGEKMVVLNDFGEYDAFVISLGEEHILVTYDAWVSEDDFDSIFKTIQVWDVNL